MLTVFGSNLIATFIMSLISGLKYTLWIAGTVSLLPPVPLMMWNSVPELVLTGVIGWAVLLVPLAFSRARPAAAFVAIVLVLHVLCRVGIVGLWLLFQHLD